MKNDAPAPVENLLIPLILEAALRELDGLRQLVREALPLVADEALAERMRKALP